MIEQNSRYVVAVRAPSSGIPALADDGWHIIIDSQSDREKAHEDATQLIPVIDRIGGDVVVFSLWPEFRMLLHRGGLKEMPEVQDLKAIDPKLVTLFSEWHAEQSKLLASRKETGSRPDVMVRMSRATNRQVGAIAAAMVALAGGAIFLLMPDADAGVVRKPWAVTDNQLSAMRAGSVQLTMVDPRDEQFMITVRTHPDGMREVVDRFRTDHYRQSKGYIPTPSVEWLTPEQQAELGRNRRAREEREGRR